MLLHYDTHVKGCETKFNLLSPPVACRHCLLGENISCLIGHVFVVLKSSGMFVIYVDNIVFDDQSTLPTSKRRFRCSLTFYTTLIAVCIIGLYRDVWIAAIASSTTILATRTAAICVRFQGRLVRRVYVTMQITFLTRKSALIYVRESPASLSIAMAISR